MTTWLAEAYPDVTPASTGWQDVDCSSYVPAGATGVILRIHNNDTGTAYAAGWRMNGSTDNRTQIQYMSNQVVSIGVDANRVVEVSLALLSKQKVYILGYHTTDTYFFTNAVAKSVTSGGFADVDITTSVQSGDTAIAAILDVNPASIPYYIMIRNNGSTDYRPLYAYHIGTYIGLASNVFECYFGTSDSVYLVGYIKSGGATFVVNATAYTRPDATWGDLNAALPTGATAGFWDVDSQYAIYKLGMRQNGSSDTTNNTCMGGGHHSFAMACDASRITEAYREDASVDFWLQGYALAMAVDAEADPVVAKMEVATIAPSLTVDTSPSPTVSAAEFATIAPAVTVDCSPSTTVLAMEVAAIAPSYLIDTEVDTTVVAMEFADIDVIPQIDCSPSTTVAAMEFADIDVIPQIDVSPSPSVAAIEMAAILATVSFDVQTCMPAVTAMEVAAIAPSLTIDASLSTTVLAMELAQIDVIPQIDAEVDPLAAVMEFWDYTPGVITDASPIPLPADMEFETIVPFIAISIIVTPSTLTGVEFSTNEPLFYTEAPPVEVIDFDIDERATRSIRITVRGPGRDRLDLTGATIDWRATHEGIVKLEKSTEDATIIFGTPHPVDGKISTFSFLILRTDIDLPESAKYYSPLIYMHEGRIVFADGSYVGIRGRMFVWPSQT